MRNLKLVILLILILSFSFNTNAYLMPVTKCVSIQQVNNESNALSSQTSDNDVSSSELNIESNPNDAPSLSLDSASLNLPFRRNDKGAQIGLLQKKLNDIGYDININDVFDSYTYDAIVNFQYRLNLALDGEVGEETIKAILSAPNEDDKYVSVSCSTYENYVSENAEEEYVNVKDLKSKTPYLIYLDSKKQKVNIFVGFDKHWKLQNSFICSSGSSSTPTVKGFFQVESKDTMFRVNEDVICKYYTGFCGNYLFHSVLLDNQGNVVDGTLGVPVSHGCVRLALENAKYIFATVPHDSLVWIN